VSRFHNKLLNNSERLDYLLNERQWSREVIGECQIGWARQWQRYGLPLFADGIVQGIRWWSPNRQPKVVGPRLPLTALPGLYPDVPEGWVLLCEGEPDALCARSHGLPGVSGIGGAATFLPQWAEQLRGRLVIVCYDSDEAGRRGAAKVHDMLQRSVVVDLAPDRNDGLDVTDWFQSGRTTSALLRQIWQTLGRRSRSTLAADFDI
jgi:hypothetical protein